MKKIKKLLFGEGSILRPYMWLRWMLANNRITIEELENCKQYFSQHGEDVIVDSIFRYVDSGFYVDCGAYHPFRGSNTYLLYRRGWTGINIEPHPDQYPLFSRFRTRDININCAVDQNEGMATFVLDRVYSGFDTLDRAKSTGADPDARKIKVRTIPLAQILAENAPEKKIHFLSVDCEGSDLRVLESNDWNRFRPLIVCVEDQYFNPGNKMSLFMKQVGYRFLLKNEI